MRFAVGLAVVALAAQATGTAAPEQVACDAATARSALNGYVAGFNRGQYGTLQVLFAAEPDFVWYAVAPPQGRTGPRAQVRSTLMTYFRARHGRREVLRVVRFNFASTQERDGATMANFNGQLTRKAADLPIERRGFKATIRCGSSTQFIVLSIGTRI